MMKRKISAILAADIVKYSKLVAEDEEETVRRLGAYRGVFEDLSTRHGGRIVNMVGDAVLAEFPSSVDAARCAIDVQETMRLRNQAYPASRQMLVRIGIDTKVVVLPWATFITQASAPTYAYSMLLIGNSATTGAVLVSA